MAYSPHGAIIAVHAANEARRKQEQEEEEMTKYTSEDLEKDWEFKIVRSSFPRFQNPVVFQTLLDEESLAGWELVEKLDDRRVRFKRKREARRRDSSLPPGIDPYRTQYGTNTNTAGIIIGFTTAFLFAGLIVFLFLGGSSSGIFGGEIPWVLIGMIAPVFIVVIGIAAIILARGRRG